MKNKVIILTSVALALGIGTPASAGNEDRAGQAGATELLINPWARSSGWAGANSAGVRGLEASFQNIAGTAFTRRTEVMFSRSAWLADADIYINSFGFTQKVGETGVLGLAIMAMDFGDIQITTVDLPEGGLGTFSPQYLNVGLSYAKTFSNSIYGGVSIRAISESISDVKAQGVAIDAGIQYVTGSEMYPERTKFGIALRNVGPPMSFSGDGISFRATAPSGSSYDMRVEQRTAEFELPSLLNMGVSYDIISPGTDTTKAHRLTIAGTYTSNSFSKDEVKTGLEYAYRKFLMLRGGFIYEKGMFSDDERTTWWSGPTAGVSVEIPMGSKGSTFSVDYSYRTREVFNGVHTFGARINL
ncbi:MAG: PorV/PorQ family protein [Flavobacteriales bacterium]|nr:PorV/PorQ family protein [Flavobacteriales bacterium]MCB9448423.1 PorV/PorQ family protein [Flavobacteriales bacterium]